VRRASPVRPRIGFNTTTTTTTTTATASAFALFCALLCVGTARAQQVAAVTVQRVEIIGVTPLHGLGSTSPPPAHVQTATAEALDRSHALDLSAYLNRTLASVSLGDLQGNAYQPDISFRGYTASPLLGTPQGLSVYLDGVRLNQPFGDVVSWDLIPRAAIAQVTLMPGSNPLFGLNTLGGALAVQTKTGLSDPGTSVQFLAGAHKRAGVEFEHGVSRIGGTEGLHGYVTGNRFHEQGWRAATPSDISQLFGTLGYTAGRSDARLTVAVADNRLTGSGLQEQAALQRDWASAYTTPDVTRNRSLLLSASWRQQLDGGLALAVNTHARRLNTRTANGDLNEGALDQSVYQANAAERAALTSAGYTGFPASGATAANTPFPQWRCIANVLLNEEPNEKCNGLVNRTATTQTDGGLTLELSATRRWAGLDHRAVLGLGYDASRVQFTQGTQFGFINADRSVTAVSGPGAFADGTQQSENAFDARVDLASRAQTASVYATDTVALNPQTLLTLAGRYNRNTVHLRDALNPGGGAGSLDGDHRFARFNPAIGLVWVASPALNGYAGANQGSRAPTAVELGCADPASPCKLPNAFAGDPPLKQVVTTTLEAGLRGSLKATPVGEVSWNFGVFRAVNRDDLLFVSDNASGYGYFKNFGQTRRQGLEAGLTVKPGAALSVGGNLTLLDATYRSAEVVGGAGNSSNSAALAGFPGTEGTINIRPGDRIPLLPRAQLKLFAEWDVNAQWQLNGDLNAATGAPARGNENGQHQQDGLTYTGPGRSAGYAVLNLGVEWRPTPRWRVFAQVNNLFDTRYSNAAQLGANGFDAQGHYIARPLPPNANGDYPLVRGTFLAPGAPRTGWVGLRVTL
jgi:outer membrane receptor protein involved in Fe transport